MSKPGMCGSTLDLGVGGRGGGVCCFTRGLGVVLLIGGGTMFLLGTAGGRRGIGGGTGAWNKIFLCVNEYLIIY